MKLRYVYILYTGQGTLVLLVSATGHNVSDITGENK